ncbi:MAG: extracellular solute-binding protein [Phycisphaerales bacterium]
MTRRTAVGGLAAAALGFVAFGPRGGKERSDGRLVLDYWEKWTGLEGRAMITIVDEFNASQDRIFVRYFSTSGIDQKTKVAIAGGDPPDIVGLWNPNVAGFAASGAILPLSDIAGRPEHAIRLDRYAEAMRPMMEYRGKVWAAVHTGGSVALYCNREHFRAIGVDPETSLTTIADLDRVNHLLTEVEADGTVQRVGFLASEPGWDNYHWGTFFGGELVDTASNRSLLGSVENVAAYEWVQRNSQRFGDGDDIPGAEAARNERLRASSFGQLQKFRSGFGNYDSPLNAFLSGKVSTVAQGPWLANVIKAYRPELDYCVVPFPVAEGLVDAANPRGLVNADVLVVPRGVRHPEACMEFVAFTQTQRAVEYLSTIHCKNSTLAEVTPEFRDGHPNRGLATFTKVAGSSKAFRCPHTPAWMQFKDVCDTMFGEVWTGKDAAATLVAAANVKAQDVLDESSAAARRRGRA